MNPNQQAQDAIAQYKMTARLLKNLRDEVPSYLQELVDLRIIGLETAIQTLEVQMSHPSLLQAS